MSFLLAFLKLNKEDILKHIQRFSNSKKLYNKSPQPSILDKIQRIPQQRENIIAMLMISYSLTPIPTALGK